MTHPGDAAVDGAQGAAREERLGAALRVLRAAGCDLDAQEALDVLWLAGRLPDDGRGARLPLALARQDVQDPVPDAADDVPAEPGTDDAEPQAEQPGTDPLPDLPVPELHAAPRSRPSEPPAVAPQDPDEPQPALPVRVPEVKALAQELLVGRALRPLKQQRPSRWRQELDESATAAAFAETRLPDVVTRPARERWLRLVLVVDDGLSMLLWHQLAVELRTTLQRLGAFRSIQVHGLDTRTSGEVALRGRPFDPGEATLAPSSVADPSGQTLVLVISDGMGAAWRTGRMHEVLQRWAAAGPTAVLHTLPPSLWRGSGLQADRWQVTTHRPGGPHTAWDVADPVLPAELAAFHGVPVPLLEPSAVALHQWARLVASPGTTAELPLLTEPRHHAAVTSAREVGTVQHFRDAASPEAYRLAAHLAAVSPVSVPVMRLVQAAVPWQARTAQLAEVFLGGLVGPAPAPVPEPVPVKHRIFDFTEDAKSALLDAVPSAELIRTSRRIGRHLEQLAGRAPDFPAWLAHPDGDDALPEAFRPFTAVERRLLKRFGVSVESMESLRSRTPLAPEAAPGAEAPASWRPLTGQDPRRLGDFTLLGRRLGARTVVYHGRDSGGREAALRAVRPGLPAATERLLTTEAEALRRMNGRYAPRLVTTGLNDRPAWLAMQQVRRAGRTHGRPGGRGKGDAPARLDELLEIVLPGELGVLDILSSLTIAWQLADAVRLCHLNGLVLADLTPADVMVLDRTVLLAGLSDCAVDGAWSGPGPAPTEAGNISALGEVLRATASKPPGVQTWVAEGMHLWQGDIWLPLRELVARCTATDETERPTAAEAAETLARYVALAQAMQGTEAPRAGAAGPRSGSGATGAAAPDVAAPDASTAARPALTPRAAKAPEPVTRIGRWWPRTGLGGRRAAHERRMTAARRPLTHSHRITLIGTAPGSGRLTTTVALGSVYAAVRGEPVLALDGAPGHGDLRDRFPRPAPTTLRQVSELPADAPYDRLLPFVTSTACGLEVLPFTARAAAGRSQHADEYGRLLALSAHHYPLVLTDWAAPATGPAIGPVLGLTDRLVLCVSPARASLETAAALLKSWRGDAAGRRLAEHAVVVVSQVGVPDPLPDDTVRAALPPLPLVFVPFDTHLAGLREVSLPRLKSRTAEAFLELAAHLLDDAGH
ncbi:SAV_2336 N-terminal domain-related protein [Streptomyces sp. NPDC048644]|uniref:SAV_2336 N-terminal domain-related protein n=1 Tax=Streptomyces sp. NPDC048644 TaxID=3365582 RepID=UPI00371A6243